jgi:ribonuclease-3
MSFKVLEQKINYKFVNQNLLVQALTHKSKGPSNNERLEFIGDSLLNTIVAIELFTKFQVDEGKLTRMRASLVCGTMLAKIAIDLELDKYIILGEGERKTGGHHRDSILADAFEALLASIFLDSGKKFNNVYDVVIKIFESYMTNNLLEQGLKDAKTNLQEMQQAQNLSLPEYTVVSVFGKDHNQQFTVSCTLAKQKITTIGVGSSRRRAEQIAAQNAIEELKK